MHVNKDCRAMSHYVFYLSVTTLANARAKSHRTGLLQFTISCSEARGLGVNLNEGRQDQIKQIVLGRGFFA